jgi:hypothetical protein
MKLIALRHLDFGKRQVAVGEPFESEGLCVDPGAAAKLQARLVKGGKAELFDEKKDYRYLTERRAETSPGEIAGSFPTNVGKIPNEYYTGSGRNSF